MSEVKFDEDLAAKELVTLRDHEDNFFIGARWQFDIDKAVIEARDKEIAELKNHLSLLRKDAEIISLREQLADLSSSLSALSKQNSDLISSSGRIMDQRDQWKAHYDVKNGMVKHLVEENQKVEIELAEKDKEIERLRNQIDQLTKSLKQKDAPYFGPSF